MPPEYYDAADTERSWDIYQDVHRSYPDAIVIGGWASWLHNRAARSHDIDLIVGPTDLASMEAALELTSNSHFGSTKWRGTYDGIHLDVYVTYRSRLGSQASAARRAPGRTSPGPYGVSHPQQGGPASCEGCREAGSARHLAGKKDAEDMVLMLLGSENLDFSLVHRVAELLHSAPILQGPSWCSKP